MSKTKRVYQPSGLSQVRPILSRVILNRKEGTVEFEYVGDPNFWERTLVGMQEHKIGGGIEEHYLSINKNGYPTELQPRSNRSFKFWPVIATPVATNWNMLSVAAIPPSWIDHRAFLYPDAISPLFIYNVGYQVRDTIGPGDPYPNL